MNLSLKQRSVHQIYTHAYHSIVNSSSSLKPYFTAIYAGIFSIIIMAPLCQAENQINQSTQIYKSLAPDGSVVYSDTPTNNAQPMTVKPIPTIPAFSSYPHDGAKPLQHKVSTPLPNEINYQTFSFVEPIKNSSFHSAGGVVQIVLKLNPDLRPTDSVKILLNDKPVAIQKNLSLSLTNIDRGTHTLTAHILSDNNIVLKSTNTSFTIHRPSVKR